MSAGDTLMGADGLPGAAHDEDVVLVSEGELAIIDELLAGEAEAGGALPGVLARVQERLGCVSPEVQEVVARRLGLPPVAVQEVVSFDPDLTVARRAGGETRVCSGAACLAPYGSRVLLAVGAAGDSSSLEGTPVPCLGACWAAPLVDAPAGRRERVAPASARGSGMGESPGTVRMQRPPLRGVPTAPWRFGELAQIRARQGERLRQRVQSLPGSAVQELLVCNGSACSREAADRVAEAVSRTLAERGLDRLMRVVRVGCRGDDVGLVTITASPSGWRVRGVDEGRAGALVAALHLDPAFVPPDAVGQSDYREDSPGVLRRCGFVDPCSLEEYIASGGFSALERLLSEPDGRAWAVRMLEESGLRLRGESGRHLVHALHGAAADRAGTVLCPCLSGDAHLAADSVVLGGDPFAVIEGVVLAGLLSGALVGVVMPPAGAVQLTEQVELAVALARRRGLVGASILGSGMAFEIKVIPAPRRLVAADESALRRLVLAGGPLKPAPRSVAEKIPRALIIDPESAARMCCVAEVADGDSGRARALAEQRLVTVTGLGVTPAVVEMAGGAPLKDVVARTHRAANKLESPVKGALCGGLLGVFERPSSPATGVASRGSVLVLDGATCAVGLLAGILAALAREACGACAPGRSAVRALRDAWLAVAGGTADASTLATIRDIAAHLQSTARCVLGRGAARLVMSALSAFPEELAAHLVDRRCPGGQCTALVERFWIDTGRCDGCGACLAVCGENAIQHHGEEKFVISAERCSRCGDCRIACPPGAIRWE